MLRSVTFYPPLEVVGVSKRVNVQVKIDEDVWGAFKSFVVEAHGQKYGNLGREAENALKEYVDQDRLTRVEENTNEILGRLDEIGGSHTHKASETLAKVERIADRLHNIDRTVVPGDKVTRAIERGPGGDDRTVRKYKRQLKRQALAYEHPSDSDVWTLDRDQWIKWAVEHVNNNPAVTRMDVIEDYPIEYDEIERLASEVLA